MRKALLIAFHYPPFGFSSGIQRSLKFSKYLSDFGWIPIVLSANPRAYKITRDDQLHEIPDGVYVRRAFALDTVRHLSIAGRYLKIMALPDPWVTWCIGGVLSGLDIIRKNNPSVMWSTYPIATAHLIGLILHRLTGIPWVADFRDSMTEEGYPDNRHQRKIFRWIERATINNCERIIFTTPGARMMYQERYPHVPNTHWELIFNGFDEKNFARAEQKVRTVGSERLGNNGQIILLHSGVLYPSERDPRAFFSALATLKRTAYISASKLKIILRAAGHEAYNRKLIRMNKIEDIVFLESVLPYEQALSEMLMVDGLLVFQAENCNRQIPAKIYEYLRARRPILALTDLQGDTANLLRSVGVNTIVPLNNEKEIETGVMSFLDQITNKSAPIAIASSLERFSRHSQTRQLASIFDCTRRKNS